MKNSNILLSATVRWTEDMRFLGISGSHHTVVMDTTPEHGGNNTAPTPMELLLISLAGCTGMDVISLLKKMRINFSGLVIKIHGERRAEHPKVFIRIDLEYIIYGDNINEEGVKLAVKLSQEKYCSVLAMLRPNCSVNYTYRIVSSES